MKAIKLNGLSDEQVIKVATELLESAGVSESDRLPIDSREDALVALFAITKAAEAFGVKSIFTEEITANEEYLAARVTA